MRAQTVQIAFTIFALVLPSGTLAETASITLRNDMPVISSDGVEVAQVNHVTGGERAFGSDETFFTADRYYNLRRIYGREAQVAGGAVRLKMTAAEFRARSQNPD